MADPLPASLFERDPLQYDALVNWPARLAAEEPFYRRLFEQAGVARVLDVACGTGCEAALFHSWGLAVEGADLSPAMIAHCRTQHGESLRLRWVVRSFVESPQPPGSFDAALCVGNSLALAPDQPTAARALAAMLAAVRPGGVCIVQVLNLWRLPDGPTRWQKVLRVEGPAGPRILLKGVHRAGELGHIDFLELKLDAAAITHAAASERLLGFRSAALVREIERLGGADARVFGSYQEEPYDENTSADLIVTFRRGAAPQP